MRRSRDPLIGQTEQCFEWMLQVPDKESATTGKPAVIGQDITSFFGTIEHNSKYLCINMHNVCMVCITFANLYLCKSRLLLSAVVEIHAPSNKQISQAISLAKMSQQLCEGLHAVDPPYLQFPRVVEGEMSAPTPNRVIPYLLSDVSTYWSCRVPQICF